VELEARVAEQAVSFAERNALIGADPSVRAARDPSEAMSKRSRRRQHRPRLLALPAPTPSSPPSTPEPERLLLDQIAAGVLDPHLFAIAEAVRARYELLQTINTQKALAMLTVGDRVRINHHATPRYLHGIHGTVVELDERTATVCVHRPIGRFKSGEIRCPPLVLDRLNPAA
jgi:hypothetical protein